METLIHTNYVLFLCFFCVNLRNLWIFLKKLEKIDFFAPQKTSRSALYIDSCCFKINIVRRIAQIGADDLARTFGIFDRGAVLARKKTKDQRLTTI